MGTVLNRFGRSVALEAARPDPANLLEPEPSLISCAGGLAVVV